MVAEGGWSDVDRTDLQRAGPPNEAGAIDPVAVATGAPTGAPPDTGAAPSGGGVVARTVWSFVGQGLSSSSNFILSVLVLSQGSRAEFATLSVVLTIYTFFVLLLRAAVGLPVTLLYSKELGRGHERELRAAAGVTLLVAVVVTVGLWLGATGSSADPGQLRILAVLLPLLLLQDTARYACFALGRPRTAAEADGLWVLLQVAGSALVLVVVAQAATTDALLAVWAGSGAISGSFLLLRIGIRPAPRSAYLWLRAQRGLSTRLVTDFLIGGGSHYAVFFGLAVMAGTDELGRLKAAQTFLGPLIVVLLGGAAFGVPESVRAGGDRDRLWRLTVRLAGGLVCAAVVCGTIVYLLLPIVGPVTFPDAWGEARPAIPLLTVFASAVGASTGATSGLRALGENSWLLRLRLATGPVLIVASLPASAVFGVNGALAALSLMEWTVVLLSWRRLHGLLANANGRRTAIYPSKRLGSSPDATSSESG